MSPSANGGLRSFVRGQAKVISVLVPSVTTAVEAAIQAAILNGAQIPCSGDILGNLQTLCSVDCTDSHLILGRPGEYEMTLTVNEVNASTILAKYSPGDTITGESVTRSTIAYQRDVNGLLVQKAINAKRDGHYIGGVRSLLLEGGSTNGILWNKDWSNAAWVKTNITVTTGISDPEGGTGASTLTATAINGETHQYLAGGSSIVRTNSIWIKRRTGTGTVTIFAPNGSQNVTPALAGWQRVSVSNSAGNVNRHFDIVIATSGDAVDVWCAQQDDFPFATSEIPTTTVAVTRGADLYSLPLSTPPQEMTVYVKFVEEGTAQVAGSRSWQISSAGGGAALLTSYAPGSSYAHHHNNAVSTVQSVQGAGPAFGSTVEIASRLFGDGSVDSAQSLNSAAETAGAQTAALALASAWSGLLAWLNSGGSSNVGFAAIQSFKIVAGARSLTEMRAA